VVARKAKSRFKAELRTGTEDEARANFAAHGIQAAPDGRFYSEFRPMVTEGDLSKGEFPRPDVLGVPHAGRLPYEQRVEGSDFDKTVEKGYESILKPGKKPNDEAASQADRAERDGGKVDTVPYTDVSPVYAEFTKTPDGKTLGGRYGDEEAVVLDPYTRSPVGYKTPKFVDNLENLWVRAKRGDKRAEDELVRFAQADKSDVPGVNERQEYAIFLLGRDPEDYVGDYPYLAAVDEYTAKMDAANAKKGAK
jgi:hypothetical protein